MVTIPLKCEYFSLIYIECPVINVGISHIYTGNIYTGKRKNHSTYNAVVMTIYIIYAVNGIR